MDKDKQQQIADEIAESLVPYKVYKKTVTGQMGVAVYDTLTRKPAFVQLTGNAEKGDPNAYVSIFTAEEYSYFQRKNHKFLTTKNKQGAYYLVEVEKAAPYVPDNLDPLGNLTDEDIKEIVGHYPTLKSKLKENTSKDSVAYWLQIAEGERRPQGTIDLLEKKLSELQGE